MANEVVKHTENQTKFLRALQSPQMAGLKPRQRFREAARIAGYSDDTEIGTIINPLLEDIKKIAEKIMAQASIDAAWLLSDVVAGENISAVETKLQMDAAKELLDRVMPKKDKAVGIGGPLVQILLPAKQAKVVEIEDD